jgi:hypothetical protein
LSCQAKKPEAAGQEARTDSDNATFVALFRVQSCFNSGDRSNQKKCEHRGIAEIKSDLMNGC